MGFCKPSIRPIVQMTPLFADNCQHIFLISLEQQQKWEAYLFSSGDAAPAENLNNPISVPMAGYGYGIPLTKVMARYLGGDIETRSIEDYGTDVYIYLQNCPETCFEGISILKGVTKKPLLTDSIKTSILVLPVYTAKTESFYKSKNSKNEWVTGKDQSIVFNKTSK